VFSPLAVSRSTVYVGNWDGHVYALDAATGGLRWRYRTGGAVDSSPAVSGGTVYVGSHDSYVYALDAATGGLRWRYQTGERVYSPLAVSGGTVYVGSYDKYVYALEATPRSVFSGVTSNAAFGIVVASRRQERDAEAVRASYLPRFTRTDVSVFVEPNTVGGHTRHRVVVGPFESRRAAEAALQKYEDSLPPGAWVVEARRP
jgi:hypothetical protein